MLPTGSLDCSRMSRKRLPSGERRALIEAAAARLFAERGYAGTRLEDVAAAAQVTKPVLYRHFGSKQALHLALLVKHRDELAARIGPWVSGDEPLQVRLPGMLEAWFAYVEEHPYAWRMLFRDTTGVPEIQAFHRDLAERQRAADAALIAETAIPAGEIAPLAEVVRSSLTGLALWWLDHPEIPRAVLVGVMLRLTTSLIESSSPA
jgi:AcrR family transcriptional regulator